MSLDTIDTTSIESKDKKIPMEIKKEKEVGKMLSERKDELNLLTKEIIEKINKDKDFYEKEDAKEIKKIWSLLKGGEYIQATIKFLGLLFSSFSLTTKWWFNHINSEAKKLWLENKSIPDLKTMVSWFSKDILNKQSSISDLTDKTYLMSLCKDKILELQCQEKQKKQPSPYDKLCYNILNPRKNAVGKVLLFNWWWWKQKTQGITDLLKKKILSPRTQTTTWSWFQHSAIVSRIDSDGTIYITHAYKNWVIEETLRQNLKRNNTNLDIMALDLPNWYNEKVADSAKKNIWKEYDTLWLLADSISGERIAWDNISFIKNDPNKFYCSELIFSGLSQAGYQVDKSLLSPWDLTKILTPNYCSSFNTNNLSKNISYESLE